MKSAMAVKLQSGNEWVARALRVVAAVAVGTSAAVGNLGAGKDSAELFSTTNVHTAHFHFTPEQWKAMEPETQGSFFGGAPGRGGPGGGRPRFGPGMFLAPAFMGPADADRDGKLTKAEFVGLGEKIG